MAVVSYAAENAKEAFDVYGLKLKVSDAVKSQQDWLAIEEDRINSSSSPTPGSISTSSVELELSEGAKVPQRLASMVRPMLPQRVTGVLFGTPQKNDIDAKVNKLVSRVSNSKYWRQCKTHVSQNLNKDDEFASMGFTLLEDIFLFEQELIENLKTAFDDGGSAADAIFKLVEVQVILLEQLVRQLGEILSYQPYAFTRTTKKVQDLGIEDKDLENHRVKVHATVYIELNDKDRSETGTDVLELNPKLGQMYTRLYDYYEKLKKIVELIENHETQAQETSSSTGHHNKIDVESLESYLKLINIIPYAKRRLEKMVWEGSY